MQSPSTLFLGTHLLHTPSTPDIPFPKDFGLIDPSLSEFGDPGHFNNTNRIAIASDVRIARRERTNQSFEEIDSADEKSPQRLRMNETHREMEEQSNKAMDRRSAADSSTGLTGGGGASRDLLDSEGVGLSASASSLTDAEAEAEPNSSLNLVRGSSELSLALRSLPVQLSMSASASASASPMVPAEAFTVVANQFLSAAAILEPRHSERTVRTERTELTEPSDSANPPDPRTAHSASTHTNRTGTATIEECNSRAPAADRENTQGVAAGACPDPTEEVEVGLVGLVGEVGLGVEISMRTSESSSDSLDASDRSGTRIEDIECIQSRGSLESGTHVTANRVQKKLFDNQRKHVSFSPENVGRGHSPHPSSSNENSPVQNARVEIQIEDTGNSIPESEDPTLGSYLRYDSTPGSGISYTIFILLSSIFLFLDFYYYLILFPQI